MAKENNSSVNEDKNLGATVDDLKTERGSGPEMDIEVAERVMGFRRQPNGSYRHPDTPFAFYTCVPPHRRSDLPAYSTDIAQAMKVVERMDRRRVHVGMGSFSGGWQVSFFALGLEPWRAEAPTLPEAICRAALHAMECLSISNRGTDGQASETRSE